MYKQSDLNKDAPIFVPQDEKAVIQPLVPHKQFITTGKNSTSWEGLLSSCPFSFFMSMPWDPKNHNTNEIKKLII